MIEKKKIDLSLGKNTYDWKKKIDLLLGKNTYPISASGAASSSASGISIYFFLEEIG